MPRPMAERLRTRPGAFHTGLFNPRLPSPPAERDVGREVLYLVFGCSKNAIDEVMESWTSGSSGSSETTGGSVSAVSGRRLAWSSFSRAELIAYSNWTGKKKAVVKPAG